jgi:phosphate-selective porin
MDFAATVAELDRLAEALEIAGHPDLAAHIDAEVEQMIDRQKHVLKDMGFSDDVLTRDEEAAEDIYEYRIEPIEQPYV